MIVRNYTSIVVGLLIVFSIFVLGIWSLGNSEVFNPTSANTNASIHLTEYAINVQQTATPAALLAQATEAVIIQTSAPPKLTATAQTLNLRATDIAIQGVANQMAEADRQRQLDYEQSKFRDQLTFWTIGLSITLVAGLVFAYVLSRIILRTRIQTANLNSYPDSAYQTWANITWHEERQRQREARWQTIREGQRAMLTQPTVLVTHSTDDKDDTQRGNFKAHPQNRG